MAVGTFYLLVMAIAMAVGGVAALLGLGLPAQFVLAALTGIIGIVILYRWKSGASSDASNLNLDAGQPVKILTWRDDGSARVLYRGAEWDAELDTPKSGHEVTFYIKAIHGSVLVLTQHKQA